MVTKIDPAELVYDLRRDKVVPFSDITGGIHPYAPLAFAAPLAKPVSWFRRMIVRASSTCTLWRFSLNDECWHFRLWPRWYITSTEAVEIG